MKFTTCTVLSALVVSTLLLSCARAESEDSGITLEATRVVYPATSTRGISFRLTNNTNTPWLMQSRVWKWGEKTATAGTADSPFVVFPPLHRLSQGETLTLKIQLMRNQLPQDRESVFVLALKAIPAQPELEATPEGPSQARLHLATQNQMKLFYRPDTLPAYDAEEVADRLRFQIEEKGLRVENPTPFYVTFASLRVGGLPLEEKALIDMIPPQGERHYPLPAGRHGDVTWQLVNDYSRTTTEKTRAVTGL